MIDERLSKLGLVLPEPIAPVANYVTTARSGAILWTSGHTSPRRGKLGADVSVEDGYAAARETALSLLSTVQAALGSLDRVVRVVKVLGMVNATAEFAGHPAVINGASDLLVAVFGDRGRHARSAIGVSSLPAGAAVEIELILEVS